MKDRKFLKEKLTLMPKELQTSLLDFLIYISEVSDEGNEEPVFDLISTTASILAEENGAPSAIEDTVGAEPTSDNEDSPVASS